MINMYVCHLLAVAVQLLSIASAQEQEVKSTPLDGTLELHPDTSSVTEPITGILWKHGSNKVAEWDRNYGLDVDYYLTYKERTELNKETVTLVIQNMTIEDSGVYSVEVNGQPLSKTYKVEVSKYHYLPWGAVLELHPDPSSATEKITGILWKYGPNKVAEWDEGFGPEVDYYGTYKERTDLNPKTGQLVIKNMVKEDSGFYSVEVNSRLQNKTHRLEVIKKVPKPSVDVKPLACSTDSTSCLLVCQGDVEDSGSVTYRWKEGDGEWMVSDSVKNPDRWNITNDDKGKKVKQYFCEMKNQVSVEQSEPCDNPFNRGNTSVAGIVVGVLIPLLILAGMVLLCVKYRKRIMEMISSHRSKPKDNAEADPTEDDSPKPQNGDEGKPLRETGDPTSEAAV